MGELRSSIASRSVGAPPTELAATTLAARFARSRRLAYVRPLSRLPTATRSGMPSAAISNRNPTFMLPSPKRSCAPSSARTPSIRGRKRLGVLERQAAIAHGERALARLAAQQFEPDLLVDVALSHLGSFGVCGIQRPSARLCPGDDHGLPAAAEIDIL